MVLFGEVMAIFKKQNLAGEKMFVPGGSASRVYGLNPLPILSFYFLFMGVVKAAPDPATR